MKAGLLRCLRGGSLATLTVLTLSLAAFAADESAPLGTHRKTLLVTGNGEVSAPPDQATVRLGATVQFDQADMAQARVNEIMQASLTAIEKLAVPRKSIRSSNLTLSPVYSQVRPSSTGAAAEPRIIGYRASNTIEVTLTNLTLVGKVIDAGIASGANELQGVNFGIKHDDAQRLEALAQASQEAKTKAAAIAKSLGVTLADIIEITEGGAHIVQPQPYFGGARMMMAKADAETRVEPGEVRVEASVTVRYEIRGP